ncbi:MAG: SpoIID/LytB domain-containing protein [Rubrobacter sp.]|nr:SpoIID/LytB domain-containing protein [Rubrobacter sp.]
MLRLMGVMLAGIIVATAVLVAVPKVEAQSRVGVCGSGFGHGVGLSQYGAKGRAEAGQSFQQITRTYYRGVGLQRFQNNPVVGVLLGARAESGAHDVVVRSGARARMANLATGGTVNLNPGRYRTRYLPNRGVYRVTDVSRSRSIGVYSGPIAFRPVSGGPLRYGQTNYRGALVVRENNSRLLLVNRLRMETYLRGVVPREMPSSWAMEALKSQAVAARSFARATQRNGAFDFFADTRDQVYGGASAETRRTNVAVRDTARIHAVTDGRPITAFFHSSNGRHTEDSRFVFGNAVSYLKALRDVDGAGRPFEGRARGNSPWINWSGSIDPNGSPGFGVGSIRSIRVLNRTSSGRVTRIEVRGSRGETIVRGQQDIRFGLQSTGIRRADGSNVPGGPLPSARLSFGNACG